MKRFLLLSSIWCPIIAITACSTDTGTTTGSTGGQASTTGGTASSTGGSATTGGTATTTGGIGTTTGGTATTTGGTGTTTGGSSNATGGTSAGSGGATGGTTAGGMNGGGGAATNTGGTATGGTTTTGGGTSTGGTQGGGGQGGKGGTTATGGASTGGSAGGGGTPGDLISTVAGKLDGYLFTAPCSDKGTGYDCTNSGCTGSTKTTTQTFNIGGTPGQTYTMALHVYGIAEGKRYTGGTRRAGGTDDTGNTGGDFLYTGGTDPGSTYNTYELHVRNATAETAVYYLNSINGTEAHSSYALSFDMNVTVVGGGQIVFRVYDSNCRQIMNCGPGAGSSTCAAPRTITVSAASPAPMNFTQPWVGGAPAGAYGQWVLIDVKSVM